MDSHSSHFHLTAQRMFRGPQGTQRAKCNYLLFESRNHDFVPCFVQGLTGLWSSVWLSSSRKQKSTGFPFIQKSQAYSRTWEAAAPFLHCLQVLASLASAPAVSWDILGWGTLSVPRDLLSTPNTIFKLSIHSITWWTVPLPLSPASPSCSYWCHSHTVLWEQRDNKSKNKFFPAKIPFDRQPCH